MRVRHVFLAMLLAAAAIPAGIALAGKPSGGGGGTGGGTIYFWTAPGFQFWSMNSDGTSKTSLAVPIALPSRGLHGGHRWLLQVRDVAGETYPPGQDGVADTRRELFAVRDDNGAVRQLTAQPDLETESYTARWMPGDAAVSWVARRWNGGVPTEGGIYAASITFDAAGDVVGLASQPASPVFSLPMVLWPANQGGYDFTGDVGPNVLSHDWSPDGTQVVYDRFTANDVWIAGPAGTHQLVPTWARDPAWSPDGGRIAYSAGGTSRDGIHTITPVGSDDVSLVRNGRGYYVGRPSWSPTGSHIAFARFDNSLTESVWRVAAAGGTATNLTSSTAHALPVAWR